MMTNQVKMSLGEVVWGMWDFKNGLPISSKVEESIDNPLGLVTVRHVRREVDGVVRTRPQTVSAFGVVER